MVTLNNSFCSFFIQVLRNSYEKPKWWNAYLHFGIRQWEGSRRTQFWPPRLRPRKWSPRSPWSTKLPTKWCEARIRRFFPPRMTFARCTKPFKSDSKMFSGWNLFPRLSEPKLKILKRKNYVSLTDFLKCNYLPCMPADDLVRSFESTENYQSH